MRKAEIIAAIILGIVTSVGIDYALSKTSFFAQFMLFYFAIIFLGLGLLVGVYDLIKKKFHSKYFWLALLWIGLTQLSNVQFEKYARGQLKSQALAIVEAIDRFEIEHGFLPDSLEQVQLPQTLQAFAKEDVDYYFRNASKSMYHLSYDIQDDWHNQVYDSESKQWYLDD